MTHGLGNKIISYDYRNQPISVTHAGVTTEYQYGAGGIRLYKVVDGVSTFYDGMAEI